MISKCPPRIVVVDEELPFPTTSGKRIRTFNLLRRLSDRYHITYVCYRNADCDEARLATEAFRACRIETLLVDRAPPPKSVLRQSPTTYAKLAANLFSPLPYLVTTNDSRELRRAVAQLAQRQKVDLWQCEWTPYMQALRQLRGAPVVVMAHNVESLIWQRYFEMESNPAKRWYIGRQWRKMERFEAGVFGRVAKVVTVSQQDAELVRERFGRPDVDVVDNGVDTEFFGTSNASRDRRSILFLGSLDWRPNLDGVRLLLDQVFPAVLKQIPSARLTIVGRNPPRWLRDEVTRSSNVDLHADVADVRSFLHSASVLAVPLRIGGGSRLKILEALSTGTPVVSTRVGAEGLRLEAGKHFIEAEVGQPMVDALATVIRDSTSATAMARSGQAVVGKEYDWSTLAKRLDDVWQSALSSTAQ